VDFQIFFVSKLLISQFYFVIDEMFCRFHRTEINPIMGVRICEKTPEFVSLFSFSIKCCLFEFIIVKYSIIFYNFNKFHLIHHQRIETDTSPFFLQFHIFLRLDDVNLPLDRTYHHSHTLEILRECISLSFRLLTTIFRIRFAFIYELVCFAHLLDC
jgi:hypothetical protein